MPLTTTQEDALAALADAVIATGITTQQAISDQLLKPAAHATLTAQIKAREKQLADEIAAAEASAATDLDALRAQLAALEA